MHKEALLAYTQRSKGTSTLLGGQLPSNVILNNQYISVLADGAQVSELDMQGNPPSLDHFIHTALSEERENIKPVIVVGPAGSGKTTALEKLFVDWAQGERLQNFSYVFHLQVRALNACDAPVSLETLLLQHHSHLSPESMSLVLQKPETLLFIFDGLDEYVHSLDPAKHTLCSDPGESASVSSLVASLLHGSLLKGAVFLLATRPAARLTSLDGNKVELRGFQKPQRKAYFSQFFTDPAVADRALVNMETTLGFYDFCTSPGFCWTVCSVYKSLLDAGEKLPQTVTQLCVSVTVRLIQALSLKETRSRDLVSALGRMASHRSLSQDAKCTKEEMASFGLQQFLTPQAKLDTLLQVDGDSELDGCLFSFHTWLMREFFLAASFYVDTSTSESVKGMLEKHEGSVDLLDVFLSGLSEPTQRKPLEALLGEFDSDRIADFKRWLRSSSKGAMEGYDKNKQLHCLRVLHQTQNQSLVKEIVTSARMGLSYGGLGLQDCVALNYMAICLGEMEQLNLYNTRVLKEEQAEILAPAMGLSQKIILSQSSLGAGSVSHLASALSKGRTKELDLGWSDLCDAGLKTLCTGLRDSKLHTLKIQSCRLTEACCGDLASALTSGTCELCVLDLFGNALQDQGVTQLCPALQSPNCKLQNLTLDSCKLTAGSMETLARALCSGQSELRTLDLKRNNIEDTGVAHLSKALQDPLCKLQSLALYENDLTEGCCAGLAEALQSENCCLRVLDLSVNELGQEGALVLCEALGKPGCLLENLCLERCELTGPVFEELGSVLNSGSSRLKSLSLGCNQVGDQAVKHLWDALANPRCRLEDLDVEMTKLTDACVADLCVAVEASGSLRSLELKNNNLTDTSVPALVKVMQNSRTMRRMGLQYNDFSEDAMEIMDQCGKIRY